MTATIYVLLPDEGVVVWRPVMADGLGGDTYRIVEQHYESGIERWQFEPGDVVVCELVRTADGEILAATRRASNPAP